LKTFTTNKKVYKKVDIPYTVGSPCGGCKFEKEDKSQLSVLYYMCRDCKKRQSYLMNNHGKFQVPFFEELEEVSVPEELGLED
jgi:hypothetical protein